MSTANAELGRPTGVGSSLQLQLMNSSQPGPARYSVFLPAALAFFQRALAAAAIFARLAALILRLAFLTGCTDDFRPVAFAHRAFWAATILALPAALILRFFFVATVATGLVEEPKIRPSSFSSD
jgi:hypothetical protein